MYVCNTDKRIVTQKPSSPLTICHIFALEINYISVLLSVCALLTTSVKLSRAVGLPCPGSRATLPPCKQGLIS